MQLKDLQPNKEIKYRIGVYAPDLIEPKWNEWKTGRLFIERRTVDLPTRHRTKFNNWRAGDIITLAIQYECPEFRQSDFDPQYKTFNCEDYYLQIEGLE